MLVKKAATGAAASSAGSATKVQEIPHSSAPPEVNTQAGQQLRGVQTEQKQEAPAPEVKAPAPIKLNFAAKQTSAAADTPPAAPTAAATPTVAPAAPPSFVAMPTVAVEKVKGAAGNSCTPTAGPTVTAAAGDSERSSAVQPGTTVEQPGPAASASTTAEGGDGQPLKKRR